MIKLMDLYMNLITNKKLKITRMKDNANVILGNEDIVEVLCNDDSISLKVRDICMRGYKDYEVRAISLIELPYEKETAIEILIRKGVL